MKKFFQEFKFQGAWKYRLLTLVPAAILIILDQWFKMLAVTHLKGQSSFPIIKDVFELLYVENTGAAFSILENQRWLFVVLTSVVMAFLLMVILSGRYRKDILLTASFVLVLAGGIGNLIDRVLYGYVIDFLYFKWINFPVFNFADCCLVIGAALMLIFFFFVYEDPSAVAKKSK